VRHATWFVGAVENFCFFDLNVYPFADPDGAVAEVKASGRIRATGRIYRQDYVLFLRASGGKIAFLCASFDPTRAARVLDLPSAAPFPTGARPGNLTSSFPSAFRWTCGLANVR
jgi:hypothetical protein